MDKEKREKMSEVSVEMAKRFSWKEVVSLHLKVYEQAIIKKYSKYKL